MIEMNGYRFALVFWFHMLEHSFNVVKLHHKRPVIKCLLLPSVLLTGTIRQECIVLCDVE